MEPITLVFATNNAHKAQEVGQILGGKYLIKTLKDIGCTEEIEETAGTLEGNALIKARYVKANYGFDCFSDDSGLEVFALNGEPGVDTAHYAGPQRNALDNMGLLLEKLAPHEDRRAQFRAVIAVVMGDEEVLLEGVCPGTIARQMSGSGGFGYDPIFVPDGYNTTFAELGEAVKNEVSHRGLATAKFKKMLEDRAW
jgi:XTP/dITP diphosphohydrolase